MRIRTATRVLFVSSVVALGVSSLATVRTGDLIPGSQALDLSLREGRLIAAAAPDTGLMWLVPPQRARWSPGRPRLWILYVEDCPVGTVAGLPLWMPTTAFGAMLLARGQRHHRGRCPRCNYEIGVEGATVCPECGTQVEPGKAPPPAGL
jgi:hypothetical protein